MIWRVKTFVVSLVLIVSAISADQTLAQHEISAAKNPSCPAQQRACKRI